MMDFLLYMFACARAYRETPEANVVTYFGVCKFQVPVLTVLIGRGREAWVVTQLALEHRLTGGKWIPNASGTGYPKP